mmetsp:Transcript_46286/g.107672  ORF Transcript_46286/g.107672 Transcript_46286/m.107672 type:complete len:266 (+) Transcript_46286:2060-2857(+)
MALTASPSVTTRAFASKRSMDKACPKWVFCLADSPSNMLTESRNLRCSALCFCACSWTARLNASPDAPQAPDASIAITVAVRGQLYSSAKLPNALPLLKVFTALLLTLTCNLPTARTKKWVPGSPCLTTASLGANSKYSICSTMAVNSGSSKLAQTLSCFIACSRRSIVGWSFGRPGRRCSNNRACSWSSAIEVSPGKNFLSPTRSLCLATARFDAARSVDPDAGAMSKSDSTASYFAVFSSTPALVQPGFWQQQLCETPMRTGC